MGNSVCNPGQADGLFLGFGALRQYALGEKQVPANDCNYKYSLTYSVAQAIKLPGTGDSHFRSFA